MGGAAGGKPIRPRAISSHLVQKSQVHFCAEGPLTRGLEVIHSRDDDFVLRGLAYSVFGGDINSARARFNRGDRKTDERHAENAGVATRKRLIKLFAELRAWVTRAATTPLSPRKIEPGAFAPEGSRVRSVAVLRRA
jgi:hypothetical protein